MDGLEAEAFNVVRQALVNSRKAAVGKVSFSGRDIIAVVPATGDDRGMMAYTLRYRNELRDQSEYFRNIKPPPPINADSLQLAETLISRMSAKLDIAKFEDGYEVAVKALVEAKIKHMALPIEEAPRQRPSNVIDLMDALRKSLGADTRSAKKPPKSEKEAPRKGIGLVKGQAKPGTKRKLA